MTDYTITLTYNRQKALAKAFEDYMDEMTVIDDAERTLVKPIQHQMDARRKDAWTIFNRKRYQIMRS